MGIIDKLRKLRRLIFFVERPYATRPVGSKFYYNGKLMKVVKERNCGHCSFFGDTCRCFDHKDILGECSRKTRTDGVNVIFQYEDKQINKNSRIRMNDHHDYSAQFLIFKMWEFK